MRSLELFQACTIGYVLLTLHAPLWLLLQLLLQQLLLLLLMMMTLKMLISLPASLTSLSSLASFTRQLMTEPFARSFPDSDSSAAICI